MNFGFFTTCMDPWMASVNKKGLCSHRNTTVRQIFTIKLKIIGAQADSLVENKTVEK